MKCVLAETVFGNKLDKPTTLRAAIELLRDQGLLNIGELAERAISKQSGVELCAPMTANIDTVTGKQIKHATVNMPASERYYKAYITRNTTAPILCVITNPILKEQYFLHIPYKAHSHLKGSCFSINFGRDGTPSKSRWWNYQVQDFNALCELAK
jgi:hypothetical protein